MNGVVSFRNTRKYRSTRRSTDDGCTSRSSSGSMMMRPSASSLRMETSERITAARVPDSDGRGRGVAAGVAATARLAGAPPADGRESGAFGERGALRVESVAGHAPVQEALDEVDLVADGVVPPDLALHGLGR